MPQIHQIKSVDNPQDLLKRNLIVKHYAGSHSYGTALPTSDVDFRGIFCAEPINLLTPFYRVEEVTDTKEEDTKFYELAHFMKLCLDCNPNIVETLWVDESDVVYSTPAYQHLRANRLKMLSSKIAFTTSGYALAQLKRIKGHNKWINNPQPEEPPRPKDFISLVQWFGREKVFKVNLEEYNKDHRLIHYGGNVFGVYPAEGYTLYDEQGSLNDIFDGDDGFFWTNAVRVNPLTCDTYEDKDYQVRRLPLFVIKWNKEEYKVAKEKHHQYWEWKKNRNEVRSELEEQFGYDTKHAMHLVRLLRMGVEALTKGEIIVKRPDAEELLSIRDGAWTYEEIVQYAENMDKLVREELYKTTSLPKKANLLEVAKLLMETQEIVWGTK